MIEQKLISMLIYRAISEGKEITEQDLKDAGVTKYKPVIVSDDCESLTTCGLMVMGDKNYPIFMVIPFIFFKSFERKEVFLKVIKSLPSYEFGE